MALRLSNLLLQSSRHLSCRRRVVLSPKVGCLIHVLNQPSQVFLPTLTCRRNYAFKFTTENQKKLPDPPMPGQFANEGMLKDIRKGPPSAVALTVAGLIPFVAPVIYTLVTWSFDNYVIIGTMAYGAMIVSFLGGMRWGYSYPEKSMKPLMWDTAVLCSLAPFTMTVALLLPYPLSITLTLVGLIVYKHFDGRRGVYTPWLAALRRFASIIAIGSVGLVIGLGIHLPVTSAGDIRRATFSDYDTGRED